MQNHTPTMDFTAIGQQTQQMLEQFMQQAQKAADGQKAQNTMEGLQPILRGFAEFGASMMKDPQKLMQMQFDLYQANLALWASMAERAMGKTDVAPIAMPEKDDRRFNAESWQNMMMFDFIKQSYLLVSKWLMDMVHDTKDMSPEAKKKVAFYTRQFVDAMSPTNFPLTNPDVLQAAINSNGQSLMDGLTNLLNDMKTGRVSMTDYAAFEVGKNLGVTKGEVVFRNRLIELIQYTPTTAKVHERPLLISPPWINRFYILDLQPSNSLVKFAVEQGFQVFMISWKNPDASYRDVSFEDYMQDGMLAAVEHTLAITGAKDLNAVGYCIGGTLLGATLAVMKKKNDKRIANATFLTTLMDFTNAGEIDIFIDEEQVALLEKKMQAQGYLDGRDMASSFALLRANDLIWGFVINNYLYGKTPMPFDILYWNDDSTRMPAAMHSYYLRNMYLENNLAKKDKLTLLGEKVDLSAIDIPIYMLCGQQDHITPWASCYAPLATMASADKTFTLNNTGHVAGVACPSTPAGKPVKRAYWTGKVTEKDAQAWFSKQEKLPDSWWPHWAAWMKARAGKEVTAPKTMGDAKHKPLCAAPGVYVNERG
ncbi:MAG: class I poly(R)-hydroxyalkanoic acid synthase [Alphaproteobacteria bacterium]